MRIIKLFLAIIISIVIISCTNSNDLMMVVNDKFNDCKELENYSCILNMDVDLQDLIKEDWDKIYIMHGIYPLDTDTLQGVDKFLFSESMPKILFLKGNKVVYQEGYDVNIGQDRKGILLDYCLNPYLIVDRKKSIFFIVPMDKKDIHYNKNAFYLKYKK